VAELLFNLFDGICTAIIVLAAFRGKEDRRG